MRSRPASSASACSRWMRSPKASRLIDSCVMDNFKSLSSLDKASSWALRPASVASRSASCFTRVRRLASPDVASVRAR